MLVEADEGGLLLDDDAAVEDDFALAAAGRVLQAQLVARAADGEAPVHCGSEQEEGRHAQRRAEEKKRSTGCHNDETFRLRSAFPFPQP